MWTPHTHEIYYLLFPQRIFFYLYTPIFPFSFPILSPFYQPQNYRYKCNDLLHFFYLRILLSLISGGKLTGQPQKGKCAWVLPFVEELSTSSQPETQKHNHKEGEEDVDREEEDKDKEADDEDKDRIVLEQKISKEMKRFLLFLQTYQPSR